MITPHAFQARGLDAGRAAYRSGRRAVLFVGPTGMGKTILASIAAHGRIGKGGRVAAFAHRRELVSQMAEKLRAIGLDVGANGLRPNALVQVTSVQSALARGECRAHCPPDCKYHGLPDADFVILDEAHHYVSNEWIRIPRAYLERRALLMGLTATPTRDDGRGLGGDDGIFDHLVTVAQVAELVALNAIEPEQGITPIDVIEPLETVRHLAEAPVKSYLEHTPGRSAAVFAPNVKTAHVFAADFAREGIEAVVVSGETATPERDEALARFASGDLKVLVNVNVLTEGWDAPRCDAIILARKIGSLALYFQCIGRGRRPFPRGGKTIAKLVDLAGNVELHGHPDADLEYSLEGMGISVVGAGAPDRPRFCRRCKAELPRDGETMPPCIHPGRCIADPHCYECALKISRIFVPTPEEIELGRVKRDAENAKVKIDGRIAFLANCYAKAIRSNHNKNSAHFPYKNRFKHFPPADVRVRAWDLAIEKIAAERGDAWEPTG